MRCQCSVHSGHPHTSLVTQPPKTHVKKGSGNIVYNELSQRNSIIAYVDTLECN